jgi:restriction endonuclease S subunit
MYRTNVVIFNLIQKSVAIELICSIIKLYQQQNNRKVVLKLIYKPIGSLADIMVGLVLKRKEAEVGIVKKHKYKALTLKSFNSEGWIDKRYLDDFESSEILDDRYLCLNGDVIIKLTPPYTAVAISEDTVGYVVPSQFIIIRIKETKLIHEYLALYLNSEKVKKYIQITATGITVPMIKTGTLKDLEIPILNLDKQIRVAEVSKLIIKERHLLYKLISEKEKFYQALTEAIIMEDNKNE